MRAGNDSASAYATAPSESTFAAIAAVAGTIVGGSSGYLNFVPANGSTAGEVTSYRSLVRDSISYRLVP